MSEHRHQLLHSTASAASQASEPVKAYVEVKPPYDYRIVPEQFMAALDRALAAYDGKAFEDQLPESMRGSA